MTSLECYENKWFYMKYIGKYLSAEILLTRECTWSLTFLAWYRHFNKSGGVKLVLWAPSLASPLLVKWRACRWKIVWWNHMATYKGFAQLSPAVKIIKKKWHKTIKYMIRNGITCNKLQLCPVLIFIVLQLTREITVQLPNYL